MVRPLAPEGERKDVSLQVRATRNDVEEIKACIQNIRASLVVLKKLDGEDKYPAGKTADILKAAVQRYDEELGKKVAERISAMS